MLHFSPSTPSRPTGFLAALGLLLAAAGAARAQTPASFGPISIYSTGANSGPDTLTLADVNSDGRLDIVTANINTNTVAVLLGQASGGFAAPVTYSTGGILPQGVAVADVNGDGRPDIITPNLDSNSVGVLQGLAGGGFSPASNYSTGANSGPTAVAVADMNSDGRLDIITSYYNSGGGGILLGLAGGGFASVSPYFSSANSGPLGLAVADVNNDGRLDIIKVNINTNSVGVLLGLTGGGYSSISNYSTGANSSPKGVVVADMNGDGRPDIVTSNYLGSTAGVLLGLVGGGFAPIISYPTGGVLSSPRGVAVGDVNGDGWLDIVTSNLLNHDAGVLLGRVSGGFAPASTFRTGPDYTNGVSLGDVNGDGRLDIIATSGDHSVAVLLNTGTFTPLAATSATTAAEVSLFPNPARDGFAVRLPAAWGVAPMRAELRNALGQVVREQAAVLPAGAPLAFATAGLVPGVYVLRVQAGGHALTKRVVVE